MARGGVHIKKPVGLPELVAIFKRAMAGRLCVANSKKRAGVIHSSPKHASAHTAPIVATSLGTRNMETCRGHTTIRLYYDAAVAVALTAVAALVCVLIAAVVIGGRSPNLPAGTIAFLLAGGFSFFRRRSSQAHQSYLVVHL